uniref:PDZ domain-containing protein n=1 Tax=Sinocyclocheilus anshuiensis TaxID=1608454 RepID=A0A671S2Z4_9TELE
MSKTLKRKKHWSTKVQECAVSWGSVGEFGDVVEILGGAEHGEFPFLGQMNLDVLVCHVGRLPYYGDVLLEVNGTPVSGLTNRDTHAVIRHFREPIRIKTVKPGKRRELCCFLANVTENEQRTLHYQRTSSQAQSSASLCISYRRYLCLSLIHDTIVYQHNPNFC